MEGGRFLHLSGECRAAITAPGYGLCYRLRFSPPSKRKCGNSCGGCGEPPLKAVTGEELERKRGMEEECGGRGVKGGGLQRIAGTGPSPDWSRMISVKLGYCDK